MKKYIFIIVGTIILVSACFCGWFIAGAGSAYYYTQIDNSKMEITDSQRDGVIDFNGGMPYLYSLTAYNENGEDKNITFGASKELREGAFLKLTFIPVRGVTDWEEIEYDELPSKVREKYSEPAN